MATRDKIWYFKASVFRDLSDEEMHRLAERSYMREYQRGHVILHPGARSNVIYLLKEGRVKVSAYSPEGKEHILAILEPGDLFGETALVGEREPVHIEAFENALVCGIKKDDFESIVLVHPELAMRIIRGLAERLRLAEEEIENLVFRDVPARLAAVLLRLGEEYGRQGDGTLQLQLRLTHHDLASMIGASRETVTTVLNRFRDEGLTDVDHRFIVIRDPQGLRRLIQA